MRWLCALEERFGAADAAEEQMEAKQQQVV
jgi:hypothetical protein